MLHTAARIVSSKHRFGRVASLLKTLYQNPTLSTRDDQPLPFPHPLELQPSQCAVRALHTWLPLPPCVCSMAPTSPGRGLLLIFQIRTLKPGLRDSSNISLSFPSLTAGPAQDNPNLREQTAFWGKLTQSNTTHSRFSLYTFMRHL